MKKILVIMSFVCLLSQSVAMDRSHRMAMGKACGRTPVCYDKAPDRLMLTGDPRLEPSAEFTGGFSVTDDMGTKCWAGTMAALVLLAPAYAIAQGRRPPMDGPAGLPRNHAIEPYGSAAHAMVPVGVECGSSSSAPGPDVTGSDDDVGRMDRYDEERLVEMFSELRSKPSQLSFIGWYKLTDEKFRQIIVTLGLNRRLERIKSLYLAGAKITDATLELVARYYPALTKFCLGSESVTAGGIRMLGLRCPNLTSLDLPSRVTDSELRVIAEGFPALTSLDIGYNFFLTSDGIRQIPALFPNLKNLEYDLSYDDKRCDVIDALPGIHAINRHGGDEYG